MRTLQKLGASCSVQPVPTPADDLAYAAAYKAWASQLPLPAPQASSVEACAPRTPHARAYRSEHSPEPGEPCEAVDSSPPHLSTPHGRPCVGACPPKLSRFAPRNPASAVQAGPAVDAFSAASVRSVLPRNMSFPPPTVPASHPSLGMRDLRSIHIIRRLAENVDGSPDAVATSSGPVLEQSEVPLYTKKFGRLVCGACEVEDVAPTNSLAAKAALNRYALDIPVPAVMRLCLGRSYLVLRWVHVNRAPQVVELLS